MVATVMLFSYGTLQLPQVQQANYGRRLTGLPDAMVGWRLEPIEISDPEVVALSGLAVHTIARPTGDPADRIEGVVFAITPGELAVTDSYEVDYARAEVTLASGTRAWVYADH